MEEKGYVSQSYEEWQDASLSVADTRETVEEIAIKKEELRNLSGALETLTEIELEIALTVITGEVTTAEFARRKGMKRTTVSDKKTAVLVKLKKYFKNLGYEI